jgi:hypothetical protein
MGQRNRFYDQNLDNEAVDRIIAATRLDCSAADRNEMSIELPMGRAICISLKYQLGPSTRKHRTAKLTRIIKLAEELQRCLRDSEIKRELSWKLNLKGDAIQVLKHMVSIANEFLSSKQPAIVEERFVKLVTNRSEFENLAGMALPNIFERRFHRLPGISRNSAQEPDGPFIRFALQALVELDFRNNGRPYSREAIAKAFTLVRKERTRRNS